MSNKRSQLVETALALFYRQGIHATGVEQIARESGVTKKTLYSHFASKEDLVLAALRLRDEQFRHRMEHAVNAAVPAERALAYINFLIAWSEEANYCGCAFINAAAEYAPAQDPIHRLAAEHKRLVYEFLLQTLQAQGLAAAERAATELFLIGEGVIVANQVGGVEKVAEAARRTARDVLSRYIRGFAH
jgi:AcrR family transcriptional regulator